MKVPFPPQETAIGNALNAYAQGVRRMVIVLPTGVGKTFTVAVLAQRFEELYRDRRGRDIRVLMLCHRTELVDQAIDEFQETWPMMGVGRLQGPNCQFPRPGRQIMVGMIQSAIRPHRLKRLKAYPWDLVIADESHHSVSPSWLSVLRSLGHADTMFIGLTATSNRPDGIGLGEFYERFAYTYALADAVADGYLVDAEGVSVSLDLDLDDLPEDRHGDFHEGGLSKVMGTPEAVAATIHAYRRELYGVRRRVLGFAVDRSHAAALTEQCVAEGIRAECVDGETPADERRDRYHRLASGDVELLISVGVLTEGFNERSVDGILIARPTQSQILKIQIAGRGLRRDDWWKHFDFVTRKVSCKSCGKVHERTWDGSPAAAIPACPSCGRPSKVNCKIVDVTGRMKSGDLIMLPMLGGTPPAGAQRRKNPDAAKLLSEVEGVPVQEEIGGVQRMHSLLAVIGASRSLELFDRPRGKKYLWRSTHLGLALFLGSEAAGHLIVRRDKQAPEQEQRFLLAHIHRPAQGHPPRIDILIRGQAAPSVVALAESEAGRFPGASTSGAIGPADPDLVTLLGREIAAHQRALNQGLEKPRDDASLPAETETIETLQRHVAMTATQEALLTRAEAAVMLEQLAGGQGVSLPPRLLAL